jgi:hypothetical protein
MSNDSLDALRPALDRMTPAQQDVMKSLSSEELKLAVSLQQRLNAVASEVEGQGGPTTNNVVC